MISVEHMEELIDRFKSGEIDIRDVIEQSYFEGSRELAEWQHENYTVEDNHHEEMSVDDLLWEFADLKKDRNQPTLDGITDVEM